MLCFGPRIVPDLITFVLSFESTSTSIQTQTELGPRFSHFIMFVEPQIFSDSIYLKFYDSHSSYLKFYHSESHYLKFYDYRKNDATILET